MIYVTGPIQKGATLTGKAAFIKDYKYTVESEILTPFGEQEMVDSGKRFNERYPDLSAENEPFIRSTSINRVMDSADKFIEGFQLARGQATTGPTAPRISVAIPTDPKTSNPLFGGDCRRFHDTKREKKDQGSEAFFAKMMPGIRDRLNKEMIQGVDLSDLDILALMELCSFDTLADADQRNELSPFCEIFTEIEWMQHEYLQSLMFWYTYGWGNPLGPTQGIGFLNELTARLTGEPVEDVTTVNHTLDQDPNYFPLDRAIYLDFTHDIGMIPIFSALGLYKTTLSQTNMQTPADSGDSPVPGWCLLQVAPTLRG